MAQVVAASWSNNIAGVPAATAVDAAAIAAVDAPVDVVDGGAPVVADEVVGGDCKTNSSGGVEFSSYDFLSSDGSLAIHAGKFEFDDYL